MPKILLLLILTLSAVPVASQTAAQIEETYGKPTLAYSVTKHILMTPDFAADGQVCRMRFFPKRFDRNSVNLDKYLRFSELRWILNQVVPPSLRGDRKSWIALSNISGGRVDTNYEYEKVTFSFLYSLRFTIDPESWKNSEFVLLDDFPVPESELPKPLPPSESDFDKNTEAEFVTLQWNDRTCDKDVNQDLKRVAEIEQRFGKPQRIYAVGSYSSLSVDFAPDGQVCHAWLYPRSVSEDKSCLVDKLEFDNVKFFLNSFVPPQHRGMKQSVNFGATATVGSTAWTNYPYKNVLFTFTSALDPQKKPGSEPVLRKREFTFSASYPPPHKIKDRSPATYDFRRTDDIKIVTVRWLRRSCAAR